jgi:ribosomal protein L7/L12
MELNRMAFKLIMLIGRSGATVDERCEMLSAVCNIDECIDNLTKELEATQARSMQAAARNDTLTAEINRLNTANKAQREDGWRKHYKLVQVRADKPIQMIPALKAIRLVTNINLVDAKAVFERKSISLTQSQYAELVAEFGRAENCNLQVGEETV